MTVNSWKGRSETAAPGVFIQLVSCFAKLRLESSGWWRVQCNFYQSVDYSPSLYSIFMCKCRDNYMPWIWPLVLHLKSCCVYEGGDDDDVGEVLYSWLRVMVGKKETILTFRRDKAPLSFRPTHDWVACRSVPLVFSFFFKKKYWKRGFFCSEWLPLAIGLL